MIRSYRLRYAVFGGLLFPFLLRLNLWAGGIDPRPANFIPPVLVGALAGFLIGRSKDRLRRQVEVQEGVIVERTRELHEDIARRERVEAENLRVIGELEDALEHIRTLRGIIPICSYCKKIRDDDGFWTQVEAYISTHSEALFSHGVCPECLAEQLDAEPPPG